MDKHTGIEIDLVKWHLGRKVQTFNVMRSQTAQ